MKVAMMRTESWQKPRLSTGAFVVLVALAAAIVVFNTGVSAAPNLVVNGDFAVDSTGWTDGASTFTNRDGSQDADGNASSGALELVYVSAGPASATALSDCIAVPGAGTY